MVDPVLLPNQQDLPVNQASRAGLSSRIAQAIKSAAAKTGVDFAYLLNKASQESGFDPNAKASTSSATGLFQFTNQTWLQMIKNHGDKYGLGMYADRIKTDANGVATAENTMWRRAILDLRKDPQISAEMAGELDKANHDALRAKVGGKIGATELYLAHFLGAAGASDFLKTMRANPHADAASILPEAAEANRSVFYGRDGEPRSLKEIYQRFAQKFNSAPIAMMANAEKATPAPQAVNTHLPMTLANIDSAPSTYIPPAMSDLKPDSSTLFATMVLAQLDLDVKNMSRIGAERDETEKKNAPAYLPLMA